MVYYELLDIDKNASREEIKKAYRILAKKWHPDLNQADPSAEEMFRKITEAYSVLSNPQLRQDYDSMLDNHADQESDSNSQEEFEKLFQYAVSMLIQGRNKAQVMSELINYGLAQETATYIINTAQNYIREVSATLEADAEIDYIPEKKTFVDKWPDWLRWILFLPISLMAYVILQIIITFLNNIASAHYLPEWLLPYFNQFITSAVVPYLYVVTGATVAPKSKFIVSIILTAIYAVFIGSVFTLTAINDSRPDSLWWTVVLCSAALISAIAGCYYVRTELEK